MNEQIIREICLVAPFAVALAVVWLERREQVSTLWKTVYTYQDGIDAARKAEKETRKVASDLAIYCVRCETVIRSIAQRKHGQRADEFEEIARSLIGSCPPVGEELAAIEARDWPELERIRSGQP